LTSSAWVTRGSFQGTGCRAANTKLVHESPLMGIHHYVPPVKPIKPIGIKKLTGPTIELGGFRVLSGNGGQHGEIAQIMKAMQDASVLRNGIGGCWRDHGKLTRCFEW
jgi:hypothetical protein